ncbi:MAG: alanine--tRNA ligase [Desulfobulbaceae bacterium]|jgi:alanyl-tRNA synthetase|nr:alanine--tRNA ligase [Desulfobulbaceae bacterium]
MNGNEIRSRFLAYFQRHGHTLVESSSLVPKDDPTLLFTNAGMVQFKKTFMGQERRDYHTAVTSQRCVRAGGKHNDLENVGYTARHHTFFEMLGNFSFGDYFKKDAIHYAWRFLTKELNLQPEKLWVTVYQDDDEAAALWERVEDLPAGRIVRLGDKDNFWAMGDTGPCGPCSEIHIDQGADVGCGRPECAIGCDCDRFLELWNLVFMQFNRDKSGVLTPLPKPSIDTGMGLERVAAVLQGKLSNYDSDLFTPIIDRIEKLSGRTYGENIATTVAMRVIADHARGAAFLIADGILPSNEGRGYVLRRILRRAVRYGKNLGLNQPFMAEAADAVIVIMADAYPHLRQAAELIAKVVRHEEERFLETLENGLQLLDDYIARQPRASRIDGAFIFKLYDTYGFPFDIVRDIALERRLDFDEAGFHAAMRDQRDKSRAARKGDGVRLWAEGVKNIAAVGRRSEFTGYQSLMEDSQVWGLLDASGQEVERLGLGEVGRIFVSRTPCYAESGGQTGDRGQISWPGGEAEITGTISEGEGLLFHEAVIRQGIIEKGQNVRVMVRASIRRATAAHHSATHLLQAALTRVLGKHVKQSGSLVGPERLRFDFTHFSPLTDEEINAVELQVNQQIIADLSVGVRSVRKEAAIAEGATALFGEKYGDSVRVVNMGDYSMELCGGTHVESTGQIGFFTILAESGIAAGVRRIEALAGLAALRHIQELRRREQRIGQLVSARDEAIVGKVEGLLAQHKTLEKKISELSARLAGADLDALLANAVSVAGIKVVAARVELDDPQTLRALGDKVKSAMGSGVAVLGGVVNEKAALLAVVSSNLTGKIQAGSLVNLVAQRVGGKGGGRADMAQAGGTMPDLLPAALAAVPEMVSQLLPA